MSAKHEPGPWTLSEPRSYGFDLLAPGVSGPGRGGWFMELHSGERADDPPAFREAFDANARLIAAAPELLEILEVAAPTIWVAAELAADNGELENENSRRRIYDRMVAALAKATGAA